MCVCLHTQTGAIVLWSVLYTLLMECFLTAQKLRSSVCVLTFVACCSRADIDMSRTMYVCPGYGDYDYTLVLMMNRNCRPNVAEHFLK